MTNTAGFTGAVYDAHLGKSHLLGLAEYLAMYLLVWSPVLWPSTLPPRSGEYDEAEASRDDDERGRLINFRATVPDVRRALANVVTYMAIDDHEVTDDWNVNRRWCRRVWGEDGHESSPKPLGKRIVANALLAYALCQAWGNTPDQFESADAAGSRILVDVPHWNGQPDQQPVLDRVADLLGVPTGRLPAATRGQAELPRHDQALRFHYTVRWHGVPIELVVTDPRTFRMFDPPPIAPPGIISDAAIPDQLPIRSPAPYLSIVVVPGPVLGMPLVESVQELQETSWSAYFLDKEAVGLRLATYYRILGRLAYRPRVVLLSGDVHYGFTVKAGLWARQPYGDPSPAPTPLRSEIAQLTASSFRHQAPHTTAMTGPGWLSIRRYQDVAGWPTTPENSDWSLTPDALGDAWQSRFRDDPALLTVTGNRRRPSVYAPEHWRLRLRYLKGLREIPAVLSPVPRRAPRSGDDEVVRWFGDAAVGLVNYHGLSAGTEIVGFNNVGEIRLNPDQDTVQWLGVLYTCGGASLPMAHRYSRPSPRPPWTPPTTPTSPRRSGSRNHE